jgi:hypothetical protein
MGFAQGPPPCALRLLSTTNAFGENPATSAALPTTSPATSNSDKVDHLKCNRPKSIVTIRRAPQRPLGWWLRRQVRRCAITITLPGRLPRVSSWLRHVHTVESADDSSVGCPSPIPTEFYPSLSNAPTPVAKSWTELTSISRHAGYYSNEAGRGPLQALSTPSLRDGAERPCHPPKLDRRSVTTPQVPMHRRRSSSAVFVSCRGNASYWLTIGQWNLAAARSTWGQARPRRSRPST